MEDKNILYTGFLFRSSYITCVIWAKRSPTGKSSMTKVKCLLDEWACFWPDKDLELRFLRMTPLPLPSNPTRQLRDWRHKWCLFEMRLVFGVRDEIAHMLNVSANKTRPFMWLGCLMDCVSCNVRNDYLWTPLSTLYYIYIHWSSLSAIAMGWICCCKMRPSSNSTLIVLNRFDEIGKWQWIAFNTFARTFMTWWLLRNKSHMWWKTLHFNRRGLTPICGPFNMSAKYHSA